MIVNLLLLRGQINANPARGSARCAASNVQGDRTMGIWEAPARGLPWTGLGAEFGFEPPCVWLDTVGTIEAMLAGQGSKSSSPWAATSRRHTRHGGHLAGLQQAPHRARGYQVQQAVVIHGRGRWCCPCLGRTEIDV